MLKLRGAYQENQTLNPKETPKLRFYINRDLETELGVAVSFNCLFVFSDRQIKVYMSSILSV